MVKQLIIINATVNQTVIIDIVKIFIINLLGFNAHEFILDMRPFKEQCSPVDVAKRLQDYGEKSDQIILLFVLSG